MLIIGMTALFMEIRAQLEFFLFFAKIVNNGHDSYNKDHANTKLDNIF